MVKLAVLYEIFKLALHRARLLGLSALSSGCLGTQNVELQNHDILESSGHVTGVRIRGLQVQQCSAASGSRLRLSNDEVPSESHRSSGFQNAYL